MAYSIGQVLFVIMAKKTQVYPMQVVEIISKKTLDGDQVQYLLQAGPDKTTTILLDKVDGEVFDNPKSVHQALTDRSSATIKKLVGLAVTKAGEWYRTAGKTTPALDDMPDVGLPDLESSVATVDGYETVQMPDGTIAKVKMPSVTDVKYVGER